MLFSEIANAVGITEYPDKLEEIYKSGGGVSNFDGSSIDELDEKYSVIGECKERVKECLEEIKKDAPLFEYTRVAAEYLTRVSQEEGYALKLPNTDKEYYTTLLMVMALPAAIEKYLERGFSIEEVKKIFIPFKSTINSVADINAAGRYNWLRHYTSSVIFPTSLFVITPRIITPPVMLLKNKQGEYKILMMGGRFHRDGKNLGSSGYTDEEGAFDAAFAEDESSYTGHEVIDAKVMKEASVLSKDEWTLVTKQGDGMAALHIPRGADLSDEKMFESFKEAIRLTKERYPDFNPKTVHCSTWMLDPKLKEILGNASKITGFINKFLEYPIKSNGQELFGFVFPKNLSYEELPEGTSLQRKLKAMYINGETINAHSGFIPGSEDW